MRKIVAYLLCTLFILTAGFIVVHPTFLFIADWLGPVLGSSLLNVIVLVYMLFGDPLRFIVLIVIWGSFAFLGGVLIRRRLGSLLTLVLVIVTLFVIMGINLLDLGFSASLLFEKTQGGNPLDVLPPLPEGLTFAEIYEAPIIGGMAMKVLELMQGSGMENPMSIAIGLAKDLAVGVFSKIAIMIGAALLGVEVGKILELALMPFTETIRMGLGGKPKGLIEVSTIKEAVTLTTIALFLASTLFTTPSIVGATTDEYYIETIMGFADPSGRAYVGDLFASSYTQFSSLSGTNGLFASVIVSHEGVKEIIAEVFDSQENLGSFTNIIPETLMVALYVDVPPETAGLQSVDIADAFSEAYKVDLIQLTAISIPFTLGDGLDSPLLSIVIYQSGSEIEDIASTYLDEFLEKGGLVKLISEASSNGRVVPQSTPDSATGGALVSGFVNFELVKEFAPNELLQQASEYFPLDEWEQIGFSGGFAYWDHGVEPDGEEQNLDLLNLMGGEMPSDFSVDSEMSFVVLAAPNGSDIGGGDTPNLKITTNLSDDDNKLTGLYRILEILGLFNNKTPEVYLGETAFKIGVAGVILPLKVELTKTIVPSNSKPNSVVDVTVTVTNQDSAPMKDVSLNDSATIARYPNSQLVSGSTSGEWTEIRPGESQFIRYSVEVREGGVYNLAPAQLEYIHQMEKFTKNSLTVKTKVTRPSALVLGFSVVASTGKIASWLLNEIARDNGNTLVLGVVSLVILALAFVEFMNLKKWLSGQ